MFHMKQSFFTNKVILRAKLFHVKQKPLQLKLQPIVSRATPHPIQTPKPTNSST